MAERTLVYVPISDLPPAMRNPKGHDDDVLDASLARFGYVEPMTLDERTGRLVAGHGRKAMLQRAELRQRERPPDGVKLDDQGRWLVPVVRGWSSRDDAEAEAYLIAANRSSEAGGWVLPLLAPMLVDLAAGPGLDGLGYSPADLDAMLAELSPRPDPPAPAPDDDVPPPPAVPVSERGDVWTVGPHRVMCGDCREPAEVDELLAGRRVQVAFTSPPYADRRDYDPTSGFVPIHPDAYVGWFAPVAAEVARHLAPGGSWFVNIRAAADEGQRLLYVFDLVTTHVREWGWRFVDDFAWVDTMNGIPGAWPNRFKDAWEPVYHFARQAGIKMHPLANATPSADVFPYDATAAKSGTGSGLLGEKAPAFEGLARPSNVLHLPSSTLSHHPAAFPASLPQWFVRAFSDRGELVYDPFAGSGSTLVAAHHEQRHGAAMELSAGYTDVIVARLQALTGATPQRRGEGHSFAP